MRTLLSLIALSTVLLRVYGVVLPTGMAGSWSGNVTFSPLGPRSVELVEQGHNFLEISSPDAEGNVFMRQRSFNQLFKIEGTTIEYCSLGTEATFEVVPSSDNRTLAICWRGPRLPSHAAGCTGCSCAQWTITVNGDKLSSVFKQSPPAIHAKYELVRTGDPADPEVLKKYHTGRGGTYVECLINNHTGPQPPAGHPKIRGGGCPFAFKQKATSDEREDATARKFTKPPWWPWSPVHECIVLNTDMDVRLAYTVPKIPCMPCSINFTFSMPAPANHYVAIGFKELVAAYIPSVPEIPNYWGMSSSTNRTSPLSGRILGTTGTCVRNLRATAFVGVIEDVADDKFFTNVSAAYTDGRISISFTTPPYPFGKSHKDVRWRTGALAAQRVMWATGATWAADDCGKNNTFGYHDGHRGLASLAFPGANSDCPQ